MFSILLVSGLLLSLVIDIDGQKCGTQFTQYKNCAKSLKANADNDDKAEVNARNQLQERYNKETAKCFQQNGCDVADPERENNRREATMTRCVNQVNQDIKRRFEQCVRDDPQGDRRFTLSAASLNRDQQEKNAAKRSGFSISFNDAMEECVSAGSASRSDLMECMAEAQDKTEGATGALQRTLQSQGRLAEAAGLLQLGTKFQSFCDAENECNEKVTDDCSGVLCRCHDKLVESRESLKSSLQKCAANDADDERIDLYLDGVLDEKPTFCESSSGLCGQASDLLGLFGGLTGGNGGGLGGLIGGGNSGGLAGLVGQALGQQGR